jgi:uncharacterized membrane protein
MAFDLENAVKEGLNRDITTNDFNVESNNLEVVLGIAENGVTINNSAMFAVKDGYNTPVLISRFDGYFSVRGPAEVHGGNILVKGTITNSGFVKLEDNVDSTSIFLFDEDPNGLVVGTKGSFGTSYADGYLYINVDDNTGWGRVALRSELDDIPQATNEPSGFADKNDSKMEFSDTTRLFTITPRDAGYDIYLVGKKITISAVKTTTITDVEGMHFIYYDHVDEQLKSSTSFFDDLIKKDAIAAVVYWDATNKTAIYFGEERHGITMDGATHWYLHNAFGSRWLGGLALGSFAFGNGSADADAHFAVTNGSIADEDVVTNLTDNSPQDISTVASVPIYYRDGSAPAWRKKTADEFPFIYDGTAGYTAAAGRIPYNQYTGGAWQLTEAPANNNYVLMHYFATNNLVNDTQIDAYGAPFIGIIGESVHATLAAATEAAKSEINNLYVSGMPSKEFVPIATCILQTNGTYANYPNARFVVMADGSDYVDWRVEQPVPGLGVSIVDHGALTGLLDDDHPQYLLTNGQRQLSAPWNAADIITTPQIRSDSILKLDGQSGIVLDAYGSNVIPRTSCDNSLGDATHGWTDIYLCSGSTVIGLNDVGDISSPNNQSGAYVIGTNSTNFSTFGPDMTGDTVQQALEAIDGYMSKMITGDMIELSFQDIYDNSCPNPTLDLSCGDLTFNGPGEVVFNTPTNITQEVNITGGGPVNINVSGDINLDGYNVIITSTNTSTINGENGIVLDGYGNNVIPADSCTDSLGDATHGWTDIYLCSSGTVIGLNDAGDVNAPNNNSGAYVVGTNNSNFEAFGPLMTGDTVQEALEAIDGYLANFKPTLQEIYNNSCSDPTVVMNSTCGPITFSGTEQVLFANSGGVTITDDLIVDGDFTVNGTVAYVNTTNLYVEDRMIRLNVGCVPSFSSPTGFEAEVGSDGYVELHWDDSVGRWEFSIDRNTTPGAQTFRPIPYLAASPGTLDLSSIGTNGYPTAGPNPDAGASVVNSNATNFPYTFGPAMANNSVQAALEAIDGYFQDMTDAIVGVAEGLTLQDIINNSCPNPAITLSCGDLTFNGPGEVVFNTPTNITQEVNITGGGPVNINVSGNISIDGYDVVINSTNTSTINGENGIVLDGYGNNVIPQNSCTDSLGDATHGWSDIYLCSGAEVVGLNYAGDISAPNNSSGAYVVGTNDTNFVTFGSSMTSDSVQGALEAIDGYFAFVEGQIVSIQGDITTIQGDIVAIEGDITTIQGDIITIEGEISGLTLQTIYNQSCPNPTIDLTCGDLTFTGSGPVVFNNAGGIAAESGLKIDGYGQNVIPMNSCTDSLGDATHGWTDIYLCSGSTVIGLNDVGDINAPNNQSGAYVIGTNSTNFITFGTDMTSNTVQAALEAIDGYLADIVAGTAFQPTFQDIYDASCPNPTIVTTPGCGPFTFDGTEQVIFNNAGGLVVNESFSVFGAGPVVIDITGAVNVSSTADINVTSTQNVNINGAQGIVLDGYGNDVIPAGSCTDSLGDATHGWTDIYLCSGSNVIGLNDAGDVLAPNNDSGAYVVGTNNTNFVTFGSLMGGDTVQEALEAIDGYLAAFDVKEAAGSFVETRGLDINGAVLNGVVKVSTDAGTPALDYSWTQTSRAGWTIPVPSDWDGSSNITVTVVWSAQDGSAGNVEWRLEYKCLSLTELVSSAASTDDYMQAASGTSDALQTTGSNLIISAANISSSDEMIVINIARRGAAGTDTYSNNAQVHLVKYSYVAKNLV